MCHNQSLKACECQAINPGLNIKEQLSIDTTVHLFHSKFLVYALYNTQFSCMHTESIASELNAKKILHGNPLRLPIKIKGKKKTALHKPCGGYSLDISPFRVPHGLLANDYPYFKLPK